MARPPANGRGHGPAAIPAPSLRPAVADGSLAGMAAILTERRDQILAAWISAQISSNAYRFGQLSEADVRSESTAILGALERAVAGGGFGDAADPGYAALVGLLHSMSKDRARQDYSPSETAVAVFSLKDGLGVALEEAFAGQPERLAAEILVANRLVDDLGLVTFEAYVVGRQEVITSQQQSLLELSTPVVKLWDGIVAAPLIGTLDSGRTQMVMEGLLQAIVDTESQIAIVDITGVSMVDTLVAQHLLKTVAATRLMGADCIISGIRPQIAKTMVHLGVDLSEVATKATLADAFKLALRRIGASVSAATQ